MNKQPDYKKIYSDIIRIKYPEKETECEQFLSKRKLSVLDVVALNDKIFGKQNKDKQRNNQKHRSYSKTDILEILDYQKKNNLNNTQTAMHFKLSRNTVAKWRKIFLFKKI